MKVIRFMTECEKEMYLSGAKILNCSTHPDNKTSSVGSCFAELTQERDADKWLKKLFLTRPCEWCVEFDTRFFTTPLNESYGTYAPDDCLEFGNSQQFREWCTTEYSLYTHPCTRIGKCPDGMGIFRGEKIVWNE